MNFMKKLLTIVFVFIVSVNIYAQENFKEGYIIKNEGDTIKGWVDYRTIGINNLQCKFRLSENDKTVTYHPGDIAGYRFVNEGKYYVSKEVQIDSLPPKMYFLEYLVSGILDLYQLEQDGTTYYLFQNGKGEMITASEKYGKEKEVEQNGIKYRTKDLKYVGILNYVFKDSPSVVKQIGRNSMNEETMIKLTREYHEDVCTTGEDCIVYEGKPDKKYYLINWNVYGGVGYQTYKYVFSVEYKCPDITTAVFGVGLDVAIPRWNENISFLLDLSCSKFKKKFKPKYFDHVIGINSWVFDAKLGLRYTFNRKGRIQPNAEAAFAFSYIDNSSSTMGSKKMDHYWGNMNYSGYGYALGAGVNIKTIKKQYVFLRGEYTSLTSTHVSIDGVRFRLGYSF